MGKQNQVFQITQYMGRKKAKPTVIQNLSNILFISGAGLYEQNKQVLRIIATYLQTDSRDSRGLHMTQCLQGQGGVAVHASAFEQYCPPYL